MPQEFLITILTVLLSSIVSTQTRAELDELWERGHVSRILPSSVRHEDVKTYLSQLRSDGVHVTEVGRSVANREIYQAEFGRGPRKVFLWSQMHGDEPTGTSSVIDLISILQKNRHEDWVRRIESSLTIRIVPMLNPDGADQFARRNLQGIDINRDALTLRSPEARLLKKLRNDWSPEIGFNLHNHDPLRTIGKTGKQAAISFRAVDGDARPLPPGQLRNKRLVAAMFQSIEGMIPGHVGRYVGAEFTPSAFGDSFSSLGTSVILIETGALEGRSEMVLVKMNFVAIATALRALADGSEKYLFSTTVYDGIPSTSWGRLMNVVFRNASIIRPRKDNGGSLPDIEVADIGAARERQRADLSAPTFVRRVGDLSTTFGLHEYDCSKFYVIGRLRPLVVGNPAELLFYKKNRRVDWADADLKNKVPPDAIFAHGTWTKGQGVVPQKQPSVRDLAVR